MKQTKLFILIGLVALLSGCGVIERVGGQGFDKVEEGSLIVDAAVARSDEISANAADKKVERTEDRLEFANDLGGKIDGITIENLRERLARMAAFVCKLEGIGLDLADITSDGHSIDVSCLSKDTQ